jgi:DNA-directed RNA polymerase subunit RPC12/RpoP
MTPTNIIEPVAPQGAAASAEQHADAEAITCPYCCAGNPSLVSSFGCHHIVSHYRCSGCWTYFDALRDDK